MKFLSRPVEIALIVAHDVFHFAMKSSLIFSKFINYAHHSAGPQNYQRFFCPPVRKRLDRRGSRTCGRTSKTWRCRPCFSPPRRCLSSRSAVVLTAARKSAFRTTAALSRRKIPPPHVKTEICDADLWSQISSVMLEGQTCGA